MLPLRLLFRSFACLLGLLYLGSVCELDAAEARQHYAHESHEYITATTTVDMPVLAPQPDAPAAVVGAGTAPCPAFAGQRGRGSAWPWVANPPPPARRLYLRYAVLQV